jgi:hypothetical protein
MSSVKLLLVPVIFVALVLGLCGDDDDEVDPEEAQKAVQAVLPQQGDDPNVIPPINESYECLLVPGRGLDPVRASCRWTVEEQDPGYLVTVRETWLCEDFSVEIEDFPPCDATSGFHEWEYFVDVEGRELELLSERGQFPPSYVVDEAGN